MNGSWKNWKISPSPSEKNLPLTIFYIFAYFYFEKKILIAIHGTIVRGNVFKMEFRVLEREFESFETSPGFTQLLGENWG